MTQSLPASPACPDLIVLYPESGYLSVIAYQIGVWRKALMWRERVSFSANFDLSIDLLPLLARHPLRPGTPTALLVDPGNGGFLLIPGPPGAHRDPAWVARQLTLALPYPPEELQWRTRVATPKVEIFWLPKTWIKTQSEALSKIGLQLDEIYPRACLWREEVGKSLVQQSGLIQEADAMHVFEGGLVQRSAPMPNDGESATQAQQLERLALGGNAVVRKPTPESEEALAQRILSLWLDGSESICLERGRFASWASWKPALTLAASLAGLAAVAAVGMNYQTAAMESTLDGLTREQRKLASVEAKFTDMQRSVRTDRKYVAAAQLMDKSPLPLEVLNRVTAALPDKYWIQHLQIKGEALEFAGRGGGNEEVIRLLGKKQIDATVVVVENLPSPGSSPDKDAFNLRVDPSKPAGGGAK